MTKQHFDSAPIGFQSQKPQKQFLQIFDRPQDIGEISLLVEIDYLAWLVLSTVSDNIEDKHASLDVMRDKCVETGPIRNHMFVP